VIRRVGWESGVSCGSWSIRVSGNRAHSTFNNPTDHKYYAKRFRRSKSNETEVTNFSKSELSDAHLS
jgi:hypothetical protein